MFKIILKRDGQAVGDLGEYDSLAEAKKIASGYNVKPSRRGAIAEIEQKPKKNPSNSLGALFSSHHDESEEDDDFSMYSEEHEEYEEEEEEVDSQESEGEEESSEQPVETKQHNTQVYKNPLDLWPIDRPQSKPQQKQNAPARESILKDRKRVSKRFVAPHTISAQAVMIDDDGYVLIRKPSNKYRGIKWEFYGGKIEGGEDIEQALRREMLEETGYTINLIDKIGEISVDGGFQKYFLLSPDRQVQDPDMETEDMYWVSQDDAWDLIGKNKEPYKRNLRSILDKAYSLWRRK